VVVGIIKVPVVKHCLKCGKEFKVRPSYIKKGNGKFCSKQCSYSYYTKKVTVNCDFCNKEIKKRPSQIKKDKKYYCSRECFSKGKTKENNMVCIYCHKEYKARPIYVQRGSKYCSLKCFYEDPNNKKNSKIKTHCSICGKEINSFPSRILENKGKFCSRSCAATWIYKHTKNKDTDIELLLEDWLIVNEIPYFKQFNILNISVVDFFIPPNICLYADGDYWHSLPNRLERDVKQTKQLEENDMVVIRLKGSEILNGKRPLELLNIKINYVGGLPSGTQ